MKKTKIFSKIFTSCFAALLCCTSISEASYEFDSRIIKAESGEEAEPVETKTAMIPITYSIQSYPQGDQIEYKLTISKDSYPAASVSYKQIGEGLLTFDVDIDISEILAGNLITKNLKQTVTLDTLSGEFTIGDSSETLTRDTEVNIYGESIIPTGRYPVTNYEHIYDPDALMDIGGEEAVNTLIMEFTDALTGQRLETQMSTHVTTWQKNQTTGLPVLRTLQVVYFWKDIDSCKNDDYTEGTCPIKGEHTFIQTKDANYFAIDVNTITVNLENGTQTEYTLKKVKEWSDWNHSTSDEEWEDDYPNGTNYPNDSIILDSRDYTNYYQNVEEGHFERSFQHLWTHKYIFETDYHGLPGYVAESGAAYGYSVDYAFFEYYMGEGEYYLHNKTDSWTTDHSGSDSWENEVNYQQAKYCDSSYGLKTNGCTYKTVDYNLYNHTSSYCGNNTCDHYHGVETVDGDPDDHNEYDSFNERNVCRNGCPISTCNYAHCKITDSCPECGANPKSLWDDRTKCVKDSCCSYSCGSRDCGRNGTSCCYDKCRSSSCCWEETICSNCITTYKTCNRCPSCYETDNKSRSACGSDPCSHKHSKWVTNSNCGWYDDYKHCGYKTCNAPEKRYNYFKILDFYETKENLVYPYTITDSDVYFSGRDDRVNIFPFNVTYSGKNGWYEYENRKVADKNYKIGPNRTPLEDEETWKGYIDRPIYKTEKRTEYRWKTPISYETWRTYSDQEAEDCINQYPTGSCVILSQRTVPKYVTQDVDKVTPSSEKHLKGEDLSIEEIEHRAEIFAEGLYKLYVLNNTPHRNIANTTGLDPIVSSIQIKSDYDETYQRLLPQRDAIIQDGIKEFKDLPIWQIYMYTVGHTRYAQTSESINTMAGQIVKEIPFKYEVRENAIGCGPGLTPPPEGCPLGTQIQLTSLLLSNHIANNGMNTLVMSEGNVTAGNSPTLVNALCRNPQDFYFVVKDYDDTDALVNMIMAEQHFNEKIKVNTFEDRSYILHTKANEETDVEGLLNYLKNLDQSNSGPEYQRIKALEQTNIMTVLLEEKDLPQNMFEEACAILEKDFESPTQLMEYYHMMKTVGLTIDKINQTYNTALTVSDFRTYVNRYEEAHSNSDIHNRLAYIDYETNKLLTIFGEQADSQNEAIKPLIKKMCNR